MYILDRIAASRRLRLCRSLGFWNYIHFTYQSRRLSASKCRDLLALRSRLADYQLFCRPHTTDILVFDQIFVEREYKLLDSLSAPSLIVDCGANVGYSSAYFLSRFRDARLIAVEPDANNFSVLERNLRYYGNRATAYQSAIWSHPAQLTLVPHGFRDGAEWSRQVRECGPGESGFDAIDLPTLLARSGSPRISLLKMDIEGAETVVFSRHFEAWIDKVDNIAIELHADSPFGDAHSAFFSAIKGSNYNIKQDGELTICLR